MHGCSHTKPYYHPGIPEIERHDSETESVLHYRLLLLGDGGEPKQGEPVLETLHEWGKKDAAKTSIVFLGDNMYPEGMTERRKHEAAERLAPQTLGCQNRWCPWVVHSWQSRLGKWKG